MTHSIELLTLFQGLLDLLSVRRQKFLGNFFNIFKNKVVMEVTVENLSDARIFHVQQRFLIGHLSHFVEKFVVERFFIG